MKKWIGSAAIALTAAWAPLAGASLDIFACEPEWGALAQELGGDKVKVYTATTALQDVHRIEARPSLIARARTADLLVCTGSELEAGWLPLVQRQSANPKIQNGQPGFFEATRYVTLIEVPQRLDRSLGDVHANGNPHIHLDPRNIASVATALAERMASVDPADAATYRARGQSFLLRWQQAMARWESQAAPLRGMSVVVYHKDMSYLLAWLGMREAGTLEPKPGLPATTGHMTELLARLEKEPARAVVRGAYSDPRAAQWLAERAKIPVVVVPYTVGGTDRAGDLFGLFDDTVGRLTAAAR
jgi:zinc/manganese transport system substrate-binding protein